ncbi:MAG: HDIG domain-containing protein [Planctomycetia bacterium]|nr:HDIG domain-containing protein [Planctomycetia bacterium]
MSTTGQRRTRAQRVAAHIAYEGFVDKIGNLFLTDHGLTKLGLLLLTTLLLCIIVEAWNPSFIFQLSKNAERDIVCRTPFSLESPEKTNEAKQNARFDTPHVYRNDPNKIVQFKAYLVNIIQSLLTYENYESLSPEFQTIWKQFLPNDASPEKAAEAFARLHEVFETDKELSHFKNTLDIIFLPMMKNGVLKKLHGGRDGNQEKISVYNTDESSDKTRDILTRDVLIGNAYQIKEQLNNEFERDITELLFQWIRSGIPETLTEDYEATLKAQKRAEAEIQPVFVTYEPGQVLLQHGKTFDVNILHLLDAEYKAIIKTQSFLQQLLRFCGSFMLVFIMLLMTTFIIHRRFKKNKIDETLPTYFAVLGLMLLTALTCRILQTFLTNQGATVELIPLLIFAELTAIAFSWEIALIAAFVTSFTITLSGSADLGIFIMLIGTLSIVIVLARDIRTRLQLITIALLGGMVAFVLSYAVGLVYQQENSHQLFIDSLLRLIWAILAGFLVAGFLPLIERLFGILTPMRLLEIGNPSHPLLLELARRAPATYNHSMQTASIAEAAAEAIGARAALIRVGAYFHDIGKMLKPDHFTENQSGFNIHNTLEPRVSTLVIVAHVKDGVDLARQYHLPQQIIDLIEQHHGTMLVSFFYQRANQINKESGSSQNLDESLFRYPGPMPQSKEAGILMLADASESASRSLGEATPGRIENLVRQISEARMEDGQLDDSGLTLGEIRIVENSIITSILASRHSRIKYPEKEKTN